MRRCGSCPRRQRNLPAIRGDGTVTAWITTADGNTAVLGFYKLSAMAVRAEFGPKKWQRARVPDIPVIYIRALAVREDMQGKRLGTASVIDCD